MKDFLLDSNYDFATDDGDFDTGESDEQHQMLLLTSIPGEWKENPTVGIDAGAYINTEDVSGLMTAIKTGFEDDGMTVTGLPSIDDDGKIEVNAEY